MFEARDISLVLGRRQILFDVDFTAAAGQVTCIVGPNGSGKTTLLKALTGEIGYSGRVSLDGQALDAVPTWWLAARRAVLPQSTRLAFPFNVFEVVRLGLLSAAEPRPSLVAQALARVGLQGFEARYYHELSGGEQQRVQLARVLVQVWEPVSQDGPRWLFLDEPVSSLDLGHQLEVMDVARDFADRGGGVIAVMHDLNLTAMYADSIALMMDGRCAIQGSAAAVLTDARLSEAYGCTVRVGAVPQSAVPFVLPQAAARFG
ncbi:MAG: heme ABC transporter ATP-binding protein [Pseudomonadota bacterium]